MDDSGAVEVRQPAGMPAWKIIFLSALCNLVLLVVFQWSQSQGFIGKIESLLASAKSRSIAEVRSDTRKTNMRAIPPSKGDLQLPRALKQSLAVTIIPVSSVPVEPAEEIAEEPVSVAQVSTEQTLGLRVSPILRASSAPHGLEIGNFTPLALAGSSEECLNIAYSMLDDANMDNDRLHILTDTDEITIGRICTANGSIILTCRNNEIKISPRRSRPDDNCRGDH
jgi:hypothetical protein